MSSTTQELTPEEKQKRVEIAKETTEYILKESKRREWAQAKDTTLSVWNNLQRIEQKERCIRVKFLDWLSDKLLSWSQSVHQMSVKIDSPCVIKLPEKTKK
jgi:hypothetical protein